MPAAEAIVVAMAAAMVMVMREATVTMAIPAATATFLMCVKACRLHRLAGNQNHT